MSLEYAELLVTHTFATVKIRQCPWMKWWRPLGLQIVEWRGNEMRISSMADPFQKPSPIKSESIRQQSNPQKSQREINCWQSLKLIAILYCIQMRASWQDSVSPSQFRVLKSAQHLSWEYRVVWRGCICLRVVHYQTPSSYSCTLVQGAATIWLSSSA